jgi:hypothetical protein
MTELSSRSNVKYSHEEATAVEKNIDGAFDFLRAILEDPSITDRVPTGSHIFIEHEDDPATTARNLAAADLARRQGESVVVHKVRRRESSASSNGAEV